MTNSRRLSKVTAPRLSSTHRMMMALLCGCLSIVNARPADAQRAAVWVDGLRGEPITLDEMLADLQQARVIYLGEYHSIARQQALQQEVIEALARAKPNLVLAMEQFEFTAQPALDRFNQGTIHLDALVRESQWAKRWPGSTNYLSVLAAARQAEIPILALNARAETIRAIGRRGLSGLAAGERRELPQTLVTDDPLYERLLNRLLSVHMAFDPEKLRPVFEAQVARDETMAERLAQFLTSPAGEERTAVVICGRGHCEFGLGVPARVARRMQGVSQRIILLSESGDLELTEQERRQAREVEVSHQFLQDLKRPVGDYFHVLRKE